MQDLRNHLFETLEALKDEEKPMDIARAKTVGEIAGRIIDTAKVEIDFMETTGADVSGEFFDGQYRAGKALPDSRQKLLRQ